QKSKALGRLNGSGIEVAVTNDYQAAQALKSGQADYYFGACASGGGASLGVLVGLLGYSKTATVSRAGVPPKKEEVEKAVREGRVAFGMAIDHVEQAVPMLVEAIKRYRSSQ
ncbi:MAG: DUF2620 domain-containing protein, partial [Bacillota bacterium]